MWPIFKDSAGLNSDSIYFLFCSSIINSFSESLNIRLCAECCGWRVSKSSHPQGAHSKVKINQIFLLKEFMVFNFSVCV